MHEATDMGHIGIDGGGTACRIALQYGGRRLEVQIGAANASSHRSAAIAAITEGLHEIASRSGLSLGQLSALPAYVGLAGVMSGKDAEDIAAALPLDRAEIADDRTSGLVGALGAHDGFVAAIGTGSFYGRRRGREIRFVGGWGFVLADEASGAWLGRSALSACLQATDGLIAGTPLTDALLRDHGGPDGIVAAGFQLAPGGFAALAPRVVAAAEDGDPVALQLMAEGRRHIRQALDALDWKPGDRLCLMGGLGPHYVRHLPVEMRDALVPPLGTGLDGALRLAADLARGGDRT